MYLFRPWALGAQLLHHYCTNLDLIVPRVTLATLFYRRRNILGSEEATTPLLPLFNHTTLFSPPCDPSQDYFTVNHNYPAIVFSTGDSTSRDDLEIFMTAISSLD